MHQLHDALVSFAERREISMDENLLFEIIEKNTESDYVDFKKEIYDFSRCQQKEEFLKDVLAMANSGSKGEKYIIFGVKEEMASKKIVGVNLERVKDQATYQQMIRENIEPDLEFETKMIKKDDCDICCFIINGNDRPYIIKKKFRNINPGFSHKRINTSRTPLLRRDLDEIYEEKENALQTKLANLRWEQNEYSKELLLIRMIRNNYNYISSKINEFESNVDGFIHRWEGIFNTREFRYSHIIKLGEDDKCLIDIIVGYHIKLFDAKILFNILAECKYEYYENYVEIIEKINNDYIQALQYEKELRRFELSQFDFSQETIEKKQIVDFVSNLKRVKCLFPKESRLKWGEPCRFWDYYIALDDRIDELQTKLDKVYMLMKELNQKLFSALMESAG